VLLEDTTKKNNINTLYDLNYDRSRFQSIVAGDQSGYYDLKEKKFISSKTLNFLINQIKPEINSDFSIKSSYINNAKARIRKSLSIWEKKPKDSYFSTFLRYLSDKFLAMREGESLFSAIIFSDIVGSTKLATNVSPEEMASLVKIFSQEMALLISKYSGFLLKYAGDAVIGYFPSLENHGSLFENAIRCGYAMNFVIMNAINPVTQEFGLPSIQARVGIESGKNQIVFFGSEPDLIGPIITMTSKIYPLAQPSFITIGEQTYKNLSKTMTDQFISVSLENVNWPHVNPDTGKRYEVYISKEQKP